MFEVLDMFSEVCVVRWEDGNITWLEYENMTPEQLAFVDALDPFEFEGYCK